MSNSNDPQPFVRLSLADLLAQIEDFIQAYSPQHKPAIEGTTPFCLLRRAQRQRRPSGCATSTSNPNKPE
jgi:hypothetical protein